jgi:hypothetical protein
VEREAATAEANTLGVDTWLVLSAQLLNNSSYRLHSKKLSDLEKRARLFSAEYREVQKSRPIDVTPVLGNLRNDRARDGANYGRGEGRLRKECATARVKF